MLGHLRLGTHWEDHAWLQDRDGVVHDAVADLRLPPELATPYWPAAIVTSRSVRLQPRARFDTAAFRPCFFLDVHLRLTGSALAGLFPPGEVALMNLMNARADLNGYDPREHGDNGTIKETLELAADRLAWEKDTTPQGTVVGAPRSVAFGLAFHAVADLYSHTSYVPTAAFVYGGINKVPVLEDALKDQTFTGFLSNPAWHNDLLWHLPKEYSADPFAFPPDLAQCLVSGGYPETTSATLDGWKARTGLPFHHNFAIDQPDAAPVHAPRIVPRKHPFAVPELWPDQFRVREALATAHLTRIATRINAGRADPLLGYPLGNVPGSVYPPTWDVPGKGPITAIRPLVRGADGKPTTKQAATKKK